MRGFYALGLTLKIKDLEKMTPLLCRVICGIHLGMIGEYLIAALLLLPLNSMAKPSSCYKLLTHRSKAADFTLRDISSAQAWMDNLGLEGTYPPQLSGVAGFQGFLANSDEEWSNLNDADKADRAGAYLLMQWKSWNHINKQQRQFALALELRKLSPKIEAVDNVINMNSGPNLEELSARNLKRMLDRLYLDYPLNHSSTPEINSLADQMADELTLSFMRPFRIEPGASAGPVMSPRELKPLGLDFGFEFYSSLLGTSATVSFETVGLNNKNETPSEIGNYLKRDGIVLNSSTVLKESFIVPRFTSFNQLMDFFDFWDPDAGPELFRSQWLALPKSITSYPAYKTFLTSASLDEFFSASRLYDRLAPLRTRLYNYVMTVSDAKIFLNLGLRHWIIYSAETNPQRLAKVRRDWATRGNLTAVFKGAFLSFMHLPSGLSLQVPVGVASRQYSIVHNDFSNLPAHRRSYLSEPFYDSRRIDHNSKP